MDTSNITQKQLHTFRKHIDSLIELARDYNKISMSREMALAHTKLQEAKMWVGKCLEVMGSKLPEEFRDETD